MRIECAYIHTIDRPDVSALYRRRLLTPAVEDPFPSRVLQGWGDRQHKDLKKYIQTIRICDTSGLWLLYGIQ